MVSSFIERTIWDYYVQNTIFYFVFSVFKANKNKNDLKVSFILLGHFTICFAQINVRLNVGELV